ncbi:MAG: iron-sulfur cluster repair di-iron protein [Candidatus Hydrogenedentes bacterium]|jgi:regulator of cell morphogenesis and NO signaling|nr:iron-sulfur cluster repair di-iron protein [Candidatus Hydrogenedentota bacterium]
MSTITATQSVGELVAAQPARSRVFEAFHIDYCCGGKRSLADACDKKGVSVDTVLDALVRADSLRASDAHLDAAAMPLDALCDHIVERHHDYLRRELPRLMQMADKVAKVHGDNDPRLEGVAETLRGLAGELEVHTMKEERVLFPVIRELARREGLPPMPFGTLANPIHAMEADHDGAGDGLARLADLTDDYTPPEWACNTYQALLDGLHDLEMDLHQHIHKENNVLFPRALEEENRRRPAMPMS